MTEYQMGLMRAYTKAFNWNGEILHALMDLNIDIRRAVRESGLNILYIQDIVMAAADYVINSENVELEAMDTIENGIRSLILITENAQDRLDQQGKNAMYILMANFKKCWVMVDGVVSDIRDDFFLDTIEDEDE